MLAIVEARAVSTGRPGSDQSKQRALPLPVGISTTMSGPSPYRRDLRRPAQGSVDLC